MINKTLQENHGTCKTASQAAINTRQSYTYKLKFLIFIKYVTDAFIFQKYLSSYGFYRFTRIFRSLNCFKSALDDTAKDAWQVAASQTSVNPESNFYNLYVLEHTKLARIELFRRGLIWKDADLNLLLSFHNLFHPVKITPSSTCLGNWENTQESVTLARKQSDRCTKAEASREFKGEDWSSLHFDLYTFTDCHFEDCDFSNSSLAYSIFSRCSFLNCMFINARLTGTSFNECKIERVDFSGAAMNNLRIWQKNYLSDIRISAATNIPFPLIEECELSYELATRNYRLLADWCSSSGLRLKRSQASFRSQYCLSMSYPLGIKRASLFLYRVFTGYNERPLRFFLWFVIINMAFSWIYISHIKLPSEVFASPLDALYYSIVTSTTLGYGDISLRGSTAGQMLSALHALIGVVCISYWTALIVRRLI